MRARKFKDAAERKKLNEDFLKKSLEVKKEIEENMKNDLNKAKKLMQEREKMAGKRVGVILSGGNIDAARFARVLGGETPMVG